MPRILIILTTFVIIIMTSCDKEHMKDYYVKNDLETAFVFSYSVDGVLDSVKIEKNEKKLIYNYTYVFGTVGVNDDRENDPINDFKVKFDSLNVRIKENAWLYDQPGKFHAVYNLIIDTVLIK